MATDILDDSDIDIPLNEELPEQSSPVSMVSRPENGAVPIGWQHGLIEVLSKLECLRLQMIGARLTDPDHLLDRVEAMVLVTEEFSKTFDFPDNSTDTQMNAMARAGAFYSSVLDLRRPNNSTSANRSFLKSMISKISTQEEPQPVQPAAIIDCLNSCTEVLNAYFMLFTEMYRSSLKARNWVDAASAFLADFRLMLKNYTVTPAAPASSR
jgi:hypothetical protein